MNKRRTTRSVQFVGGLLAAIGPWGERPLAPAALRAQSVAGHVISAESSVPLAGAFVRLLGTDGRVLDAVYASPSGAFTLQGPAAGETRVAVFEPGFRDWQGPGLRLEPGRPIESVLRVPRQPVRWPSVVPESADLVGCPRDPAAQLTIAPVWELVRVALQQVDHGERDPELRFGRQEYRHVLDRARPSVSEPDAESLPPAAGPAYDAPTPTRLSRSGYVQRRRDSVQFYAPDARALLSSSFRATHCFSAAHGGTGDTARVGLRFWPMAGSALPDIAGTLWLSRAGGHLLDMNFRYTGVRWAEGVDSARVGGWVRYGRVAGVGTFVRDWWLRHPVPALALADSSGPEEPSLIEYVETGGRTRSIERDGVRTFHAGGPALSGRVGDSTTDPGVPGSGVVLRTATPGVARRRSVMPGVPPRPAESGRVVRVTRIDRRGRYVFPELPPGEYRVELDHPRLQALGVGTVGVALELQAGTDRSLDLPIPDDVSILPGLCGRASVAGQAALPPAAADAGPAVRTALVGILRNRDTLHPLAGGEVEARWGAAEGEGLRAITDREGRFVMCGVPKGADLRIAPTHPALMGEARVRQDRPVSWADLYVSAG